LPNIHITYAPPKRHAFRELGEFSALVENCGCNCGVSAQEILIPSKVTANHPRDVTQILVPGAFMNKFWPHSITNRPTLSFPPLRHRLGRRQSHADSRSLTRPCTNIRTRTTTQSHWMGKALFYSARFGTSSQGGGVGLTKGYCFKENDLLWTLHNWLEMLFAWLQQ